jgi:hypothetical protein
METLVAAFVALMIGVAFCFYGYRVFLVMLPIWGFFAGLWLGVEGVSLILGEGFLATTTGLVVGFFLGLVTAVLSYLFYFAGVAIVAFGFGAAVAVGLLTAIGVGADLVLLIAGIAGGIVVAAVTLLFNIQKYAIELITAIGGANGIVLAPLLLFDRVSLDSLETAGNSIKPVLADSGFWLVVWLAVAAAGFVFQLRQNRTFTFSKERYVEGWG